MLSGTVDENVTKKLNRLPVSFWTKFSVLIINFCTLKQFRARISSPSPTNACPASKVR